jgi:hypothetical protein
LGKTASVDVAADGECRAENAEGRRPRDEDESSRRWAQKMLGRELDQRILCINGPETAHTGQEPEDDVLGDEAPREQRDDRSDLITDDRAQADADSAPESRACDRAEKEERDLAAVEGEVDAAAGEARVADPAAARSTQPILQAMASRR